MRMEWEDDVPFGADPWVVEDANAGAAVQYGAGRLDLLLPADEQTGVATPAAMHIYLDAMIEMVGRGIQPLSLLCIAVDETPIIRFFGSEGVNLIGRAVARCLRQETRGHDVVGRADVDKTAVMPIFLVVCPLLNEEQTTQLGERLLLAMTAHAEPGQPWLTLSVGVAALALDISNSQELIARAYSAMHRAQNMGGGRVLPHSHMVRDNFERWEQEPPEGQF
jgi:GGDEF domain-containing protein